MAHRMTIEHFGKSMVIFWFVVMAFFLSSCSGMIGRRSQADLETAEEAQRMLSTLTEVNDALNTFKGLGNIAFTREGIRHDARMAWIGTEAGRFRLEVFSFFGTPIASLAGDEDWVYANLNDRQRFYKIKKNKANLKHLIAIPVTTEDVVTLLSGRVPLPPYHDAAVRREESWHGPLLLLKNRRGRVLQKIYLDDAQTSVQKIEKYDGAGALVYRVVFEGMQIVDGFTVPREIHFFSGTDAEAVLTIEKYWPNVHVSPDVFELQPLS